MKIANVADIHLRGKDLKFASAQLQAMVDVCLEKEVDLVLIAGDLFDRSQIGDNYASTGAIVEQAMILRMLPEVVIIPGNHDFSGVGSKDALHIFDRLINIEVVRKAEDYIYQDVHVSCLPWSWDPADNPEEKIRGLIDDIYYMEDIHDTKYTRILLAHIQVIGAKMQGSFCCEKKPGTWQISREFLESISEHFDRFVFGDFHARQELVAGKGGYVGAIRQLNFGEEGNPTGFEIYDTETGSVEWIKLDAAPRYNTITMKENDMPDFNPNNHNRIIYETCEPDPATVKIIEQYGAEVVKVIPKQERLIRAAFPEGIAQKPKDLITLWASTQNPPITDEKLTALINEYDSLHSDVKTREEAFI